MTAQNANDIMLEQQIKNDILQQLEIGVFPLFEVRERLKSRGCLTNATTERLCLEIVESYEKTHPRY